MISAADLPHVAWFWSDKGVPDSKRALKDGPLTAPPSATSAPCWIHERSAAASPGASPRFAEQSTIDGLLIAQIGSPFAANGFIAMSAGGPAKWRVLPIREASGRGHHVSCGLTRVEE